MLGCPRSVPSEGSFLTDIKVYSRGELRVCPAPAHSCHWPSHLNAELQPVRPDFRCDLEQNSAEHEHTRMLAKLLLLVRHYPSSLSKAVEALDSPSNFADDRGRH